MITASQFIQILQDNNVYNLKKLEYKYGKTIILEFINLLKESSYKQIPIKDFNNNFLVFCPALVNISDSAYQFLLSSENLKVSNLEQEIKGTLDIENIESTRNSIRNIIKGYAPQNSNENKIYGIKKGLDFISNKQNKINKENLYKLYNIVMDNNLENNEHLIEGNYYRHDSVYIVGNKISHQGLNHNLLPQYMEEFINFINTDDNMNVIIKSITIHFYLSYLHPYFNGNGRMARLLHLWFLIQNNFNTNFLVPFSEFISKTKNKYYKSFEVIEQNANISNIIDISPFIAYFTNNIFANLKHQPIECDSLKIFKEALKQGKITSKEKDLFMFISSTYSDTEFSTKQLEKDFQNAAYATIRSFVLKFTELGILSSQQYGNRTKYKLIL